MHDNTQQTSPVRVRSYQDFASDIFITSNASECRTASCIGSSDSLVQDKEDPSFGLLEATATAASAKRSSRSLGSRQRHSLESESILQGTKDYERHYVPYVGEIPPHQQINISTDKMTAPRSVSKLKKQRKKFSQSVSEELLSYNPPPPADAKPSATSIASDIHYVPSVGGPYPLVHPPVPQVKAVSSSVLSSPAPLLSHPKKQELTSSKSVGVLPTFTGDAERYKKFYVPHAESVATLSPPKAGRANLLTRSESLPVSVSLPPDIHYVPFAKGDWEKLLESDKTRRKNMPVSPKVCKVMACNEADTVDVSVSTE